MGNREGQLWLALLNSLIVTFRLPLLPHFLCSLPKQDSKIKVTVPPTGGQKMARHVQRKGQLGIKVESVMF